MISSEDDSRLLSRQSPLSRFLEIVKNCLGELYDIDGETLRRNKGRGVSERAIVFRFAYYLQNAIDGYFVDCDFNSSFEGYRGPDGKWVFQDRHGKPIREPDGNVTNRFVDIIVHKRDKSLENDLICFEFKKWNNTNRKDFEKDENNLRVLTSTYGYVYGFHITIHKRKGESKWTIFHKGRRIEENSRIFA